MVDTPTFESLHTQWVEAFNDHDLDRHMALYAEDAVLFGSVDELQVGRDRIREYFAGRPANMRVAAYPMPRIAMIGDGMMATAGHVDFVDGMTAAPYRMTWVLIRRLGNWLIAQHHGSPRTGR